MNWERKYIITRSRLRDAMENQIPVRCKDCKHCWTNYGVRTLFCDYLLCDDASSLQVRPNDFCAWGEKE